MSKWITSILLLLFLTISYDMFAIDVESIRISYERAVKDESLCQKMIATLSQKTDSAIYLGYLGAFQAIWANHVSSPFAKLSTFKIGKRNIEKSIQIEPNNVELRFIRLSIQLNCPFFLNYRHRIEEDKLFIKNNLNTIASESLKQMCLRII